jgi:hypothetical protein
MTICDGCGNTVDAEHIRQRIERLELATRYRPVHIHTLLVGTAPPPRAEEYLYASEKEAAELQKNGIFLAYAVECPLGERNDAHEALRRVVPTMLKRVQFSYKPQWVVLFSPATAELIAPMQAAGMADRLVLHNSAPYPALLDAIHDKAAVDKNALGARG